MSIKSSALKTDPSELSVTVKKPAKQTVLPYKCIVYSILPKIRYILPKMVCISVFLVLSLNYGLVSWFYDNEFALHTLEM